jgi:hypothetical protein
MKFGSDNYRNCFWIIPVSPAIFAEVLNKKDAYQERLREMARRSLDNLFPPKAGERCQFHPPMAE